MSLHRMVYGNYIVFEVYVHPFNVQRFPRVRIGFQQSLKKRFHPRVRARYEQKSYLNTLAMWVANRTDVQDENSHTLINSPLNPY
jgi:hypothetical protein